MKEDYDPNKYGHSRWLVNDGADGVFDAVIVTIGTCGDLALIEFDGRDVFERQPGKKVIHSSQLDKLLKEYKDENGASGIKDKKFVIIGSGASGVEAAEWAFLHWNHPLCRELTLLFCRGFQCLAVLHRESVGSPTVI